MDGTFFEYELLAESEVYATILLSTKKSCPDSNHITCWTSWRIPTFGHKND